MPRFDGSNPTAWIFKADHYFAYYNISDEECFTTPSIYMDGAASTWFQWMHNNRQLTTWNRFKQSIMTRFGPSSYRDLQGELAKLTQQTTVQAYYGEFEALANQINGVPLTFLQSYFESGLRRGIHREVRALQPHSLEQAFQLAKLMEDRLVDTPFPHPHYRPYRNPPPHTGHLQPYRSNYTPNNPPKQPPTSGLTLLHYSQIHLPHLQTTTSPLTFPFTD